MQQTNLAAIDLGTNSCRLYITDIQGKVLYHESVTTKLGEGLHENGRFTTAAIERGLTCLANFAKIMQQYNVVHYRAIATASCRMADNGQAFIKTVSEMCDIKMEIIDSREEALLNLKGSLANAPKDKAYVLVYDLGGGSTEITLATNEPEPKMLYTISIPWGARNASEAFDIIEYDSEKARRLEQEIKGYAHAFKHDSELLHYFNQCAYIATSSTPLRLMSMLYNTGKYNREQADGMKASTADLSRQIAAVEKMNFIELSQSPYIGENRASVFIAACIIFKTIYDELQIPELTASLKGAKEAMIEDLRQQWQN